MFLVCRHLPGSSYQMLLLRLLLLGCTASDGSTITGRYHSTASCCSRCAGTAIKRLMCLATAIAGTGWASRYGWWCLVLVSLSPLQRIAARARVLSRTHQRYLRSLLPSLLRRQGARFGRQGTLLPQAARRTVRIIAIGSKRSLSLALERRNANTPGGHIGELIVGRGQEFGGAAILIVQFVVGEI